jgi:hypothetical protein
MSAPETGERSPQYPLLAKYLPSGLENIHPVTSQKLAYINLPDKNLGLTIRPYKNLPDKQAQFTYFLTPGHDHILTVVCPDTVLRTDIQPKSLFAEIIRERYDLKKPPVTADITTTLLLLDASGNPAEAQITRKVMFGKKSVNFTACCRAPGFDPANKSADIRRVVDYRRSIPATNSGKHQITFQAPDFRDPLNQEFGWQIMVYPENTEPVKKYHFPFELSIVSAGLGFDPVNLPDRISNRIGQINWTGDPDNSYPSDQARVQHDTSYHPEMMTDNEFVRRHLVRLLQSAFDIDPRPESSAALGDSLLLRAAGNIRSGASGNRY